MFLRIFYGKSVREPFYILTTHLEKNPVGYWTRWGLHLLVEHKYNSLKYLQRHNVTVLKTFFIPGIPKQLGTYFTCFS